MKVVLKIAFNTLLSIESDHNKFLHGRDKAYKIFLPFFTILNDH